MPTAIAPSVSLPLWSDPLATARWITGPAAGGPRTIPPAHYFRRVFTLDATPPSRAILQITALGLFECELNGQRVGNDVLAPGWTDYDKRLHYHTYDVTDLLRHGENVLGVILGDGWYSGHVATAHREFHGDRPTLLASLESHPAPHHADAPVTPAVLVATDASWTFATGPILANDLIMGEAYDARRELGAWSSPGFVPAPDAPWSPVILRPSVPSIPLERSPAPPMRRHEILPGQLLPAHVQRKWSPPEIIYDFGQNLTGRIRLRVRGPRGLTLRIRHGEMLQPGGALYTDNLRTALATDYYTLKGDGLEEWEPRFTFHGFRYAELQWNSKQGKPEIESLEAVVLHTAAPRTGEFACSHPLLNQLASNILWGQKGNFLDVPTDCPQRDERQGWTGDAQVFIRTSAFFMDVRGFFLKWLKDLRDTQQPEGQISAVAPDTGFFGPHDGGPAWSDAIFICPWTLYLCYGDLDALRDNYEAMTRYHAYLAAHKVKDHIRAHPEMDGWGGFGDWLALDGSGQMEGATPRDLIGTAFYAYASDILARSAELLAKPADAARYRALHADIVRAFQRRFLTSDGLLASGTQTAYVLALHFDLLPEAMRPAAARQLVRLIEKNENRIGTGFIGTPYILSALEKQGHLDVAYRLLEQEAFPSWLFPVKNGATTIWERWDGWTPDKGFQDTAMNSFNHYAYGAVGAWMVTTVAGLELDAAEPGYRHIIFKPRPGGTLTHARAQLATSLGDVSISWRLSEGQLQLDLVVPPDARATLDLPVVCATASRSLPPGAHRLSFPHPVA